MPACFCVFLPRIFLIRNLTTGMNKNNGTGGDVNEWPVTPGELAPYFRDPHSKTHHTLHAYKRAYAYVQSTCLCAQAHIHRGCRHVYAFVPLEHVHMASHVHVYL